MINPTIDSACDNSINTQNTVLSKSIRTKLFIKEIFTEFHWHNHTQSHTHMHALILTGHKKQRGPKTTVISGKRRYIDVASIPRSLTGSNSISPRCCSMLPLTFTTISTCEMIRQKRHEESMCTLFFLFSHLKTVTEAFCGSVQNRGKWFLSSLKLLKTRYSLLLINWISFITIFGTSWLDCS